MATTSQNIATIIAQAEILDELIDDFRTAAALIVAAAMEIHKAQPCANHDAIDGRLNLVDYAKSLMTKPSIANDVTVSALVTKAWAGVS